MHLISGQRREVERKGRAVRPRVPRPGQPCPEGACLERGANQQDLLAHRLRAGPSLSPGRQSLLFERKERSPLKLGQSHLSKGSPLSVPGALSPGMAQVTSKPCGSPVPQGSLEHRLDKGVWTVQVWTISWPPKPQNGYRLQDLGGSLGGR